MTAVAEVYLVGAGPGDPGLLTLRAAELLRRADTVIHDRLVSPEIMAMVAPWAELVDVGKRPGQPGPTQHEINSILVDRARRGGCVVRLKGGDPHVFGRAGEEVAALHRAGFTAEVIPGVSSAVAGPTAAGIPLTSRSVSSGFTVVTAHQDPANDRVLDWNALARLGTTLVVLMGAARAGAIATALTDGGMDPATPVAVVTNATTPLQTDERLTLAELVSHPVRPPSVIVIGDAAAVDLRRVPSATATFHPSEALT
jgi:uroporphyrin-III C-methyltransferase